jgi:hypothetical protein
MERIMYSAYLGKSKSSFEKIGEDLFIFGFAFGESDDHVLQLIGKQDQNGLRQPVWRPGFGLA